MFRRAAGEEPADAVDEPAAAGAAPAVQNLDLDAYAQATGLALLPTWMVAGDLRDGALVRCLAESVCYPEGYREEIYAVHARTPLVPAKTRAFVAHRRRHIDLLRVTASSCR